MHRGMWTIFQLLLLAFWAAGDTVQIPGIGDVIGTTATSSGGNTIYSFYAIPYALPLTGDTRFKKPIPHPGWADPLNCTTSGPACPQPEKFISHFTPNGTVGVKETSQDCLHLDVHTRSVTAGDSKLPVLVFFHGGGFTLGSSGSIKPDFLLDHEIVLVVPQFRLGVLGFMSLGKEYIPGNAALFDQSLALKWVQDNIASFNGDPAKVTIAGHSTGAALATLHMFSPVSKGLFSQVIAHGGSGIASWAIAKDPTGSAQGIANMVHCNGEDMESCFKKKSTEELVNSYTMPITNVDLLSPAIQADSNAAFITQHPFDTIRSQKYNDVPILAGFNKHEGMLFTEYVYKLMVENKLDQNEDFLKNELVRTISKLYDVPDTSGVLADALTKRYFNESELGDFKTMYAGLIDLCGSAFSKGSIYRMVQFNSDVSTNYLYVFNFYSQNHLVDHIDGLPAGDGVIHGDELMYLFPQEGITLNAEEKKTSQTLTQIWADFVINGNPAPATRHINIPAWEQYNKEDDKYLVIANDGITVAQGFRQQLTITHDDGLEFGHSGGHISSKISLTVLSIAAFFMLFR